MSLRGAINTVQRLALECAGVKSAPQDPKEALKFMPFAVSYLSNFTLQRMDASFKKDIHTIFAEVHISRALLDKAIDQGYDILEEFGLKLEQNPTLPSTDNTDQVDTIIYPIRGTFGRVNWAGDEHIGFRLEIDVKIQGSLTT